MKAAVLQEPGEVEVREVPNPSCGDGEVLIKVESCAVCGTDVRIFRHGHHNVKYPAITGHEVAGVVAKMGDSVDKGDLQEGNRVIVAPGIGCGNCHFCQRGLQNLCPHLISIGYHLPGGFAEFLAVPSRGKNNIIRIPDGFSFDKASLAEPLSCCINGQKSLDFSLEETVLIIGAGPIGFMHSQLAKLKGVSRVIVADVTEAKLEFVKKVDPMIEIILSQDDTLGDQLLRKTEGKGVENVIVACSSRKAQMDAPKLAAKKGKVVFFGGLPNKESSVEFDTNLIHYNELTILGSFASTVYQHTIAIEVLSSQQAKIDKCITSVFPLSRINEAFHRMEQGKEMKVVIKPHMS